MPWEITAKSEGEAELILYDVIGGYNSDWERQNAKWLIDKIKALGDVSRFTIRINSVGGDVFEAQAMYSYLKTHRATKTVRIDGLAASAASLIAMVGDRIVMPENALMMIHNPMTLAVGEAKDMRKAAEILDKVRDTLVAVYEARTGLEREKIVELMDDETWMAAADAQEMGFCDETDEPIEIAACADGGSFIWNTAAGGARLSPEIAARLPDALRPEEISNPRVPARPNNKIERVPYAVTPRKTNESKEARDVEIKNVADLENVHPALVKEIRDSAEKQGHEKGVSDERERLKVLDSMATPWRKEIIDKAKYDEPRAVQDVAIELLQVDANHQGLADRQDDAKVVNVAINQTVNPDPKAIEDAVIDAVAGEINRKRGYEA